MVATKKKSSKKRSPVKANWAETMKQALDKKRPAGGWPDQGKPRDSAVKKLRKNAF